MINSLAEYLIKNGYNAEDTADIEIAYLSGGIEEAVNAFRWADDTEHDYSGELRLVIEAWQTGKSGIKTDKPQNEIYMEDVSTISLDAIKVIEDGLKKFGIALTDKQVDEIYVPMLEKLEELSKWPDYRHEH